MNERLIKEDQLEYQEEMRAHYRDLLSELSAIMNEQVSAGGANSRDAPPLSVSRCLFAFFFFLLHLIRPAAAVFSFLLLILLLLSLQLPNSALAAGATCLSSSSLSNCSKPGMSCDWTASGPAHCCFLFPTISFQRQNRIVVLPPRSSLPEP